MTSSLTRLQPQILIVGSGPSGLILALSLSRNGTPVRVIEKSKTNRIGQRGAGITPRSLEIFEALGIADEILKRSIKPPLQRMYKMPEGIEVLKEFPLLPEMDRTPSNPYPNFVMLGQDNLDKIIRAQLEKYGVFVELGVELQALQQFEDRVVAKILKYSLRDGAAPPELEEKSYKFVVGADGAKGIVRKQIGLSFLGDTLVENFVVGDIKASFDAERWHLWGEMSTTMVSLRPTEDAGVFNFLLGGIKLGNPTEICANEDNLKEIIKRATRKDIIYGEVICMWPYRVNIRMCNRFQRGRTFVTGDAGHVHSPAGGQGMNTGVQDSFNLGWKLALVWKGHAPLSLLETYNEERVPVVAEMLNITTDMMKKTFSDMKDQKVWERPGKLRQFGVNYRWSSIVLDEDETIKDETISSYNANAEGPFYAGDRAPDAIAQDGTRLFKLFDPAKHTVIIFFPDFDHKVVLAKLERYPKGLIRPIIIAKKGDARAVGDELVFEDSEGHARDVYKGQDGRLAIFVVRPDGMIGSRVASADLVESYFERIFHGL